MDSERKNPPSSAAIATASRRLAMAFEHAMSNPCAGLLDHGSPEQRVQHAQAEYSRLMNSSNLTTFSILPSEIRGHSGQETIRKEGMVALEGDLLRDPNCEEAKKGAGFKSLADPMIDTTSPHGKLILSVLAALAEFERSMILARTSEGRKRAMSRGVQ